jgi:hypothetical protein
LGGEPDGCLTRQAGTEGECGRKGMLPTRGVARVVARMGLPFGHGWPPSSMKWILDWRWACAPAPSLQAVATARWRLDQLDQSLQEPASREGGATIHPVTTVGQLLGSSIEKMSRFAMGQVTNLPGPLSLLALDAGILLYSCSFFEDTASRHPICQTVVEDARHMTGRRPVYGR